MPGFRELREVVNITKDIPKKRIALINPPSEFLTDDKTFLSLGLLNIAAVAREGGHNVHLEDLAGRNDYLERARKLAELGRFNIYGVTAVSPQYGYAVKILDAIKDVHADSHVVVGGPHASMFSALRRTRLAELRREYPNADQVSLEKILYERDPNFSSLERFDQIVEGEELGIFDVIQDNELGMYRKWLNSGLTRNLDSLPFAARDLIIMDEYAFKDDGSPKFELNGGPATSVISQRGCPFACLFCSGRDVPQYRNIKIDGELRAHSAERMVEEFNALNATYGFTGFMIYDDELNIDKKRFIRLMEVLKDNNDRRIAEGLPPFGFRGFVKSEIFVRHPEQAFLMRGAGFRELMSGFESGSNRILKNYVKKNTTMEINLRASEIAFDNNLEVKALTMTGHPTETYDDIMKTKEFLNKIGKMAEDREMQWHFDITILTPYPGSPIYDNMKVNNGKFREKYPRVLGDGDLYMKLIDFAEEGVGAYKTRPGEERPIIRTPTLSGSDLFRIRTEVDREVRERFGVKIYYDARADIEHSMGQTSVGYGKSS